MVGYQLNMKILKNEAASNRQEFVTRTHNNPTYKKMKSICDKYGYELCRAYWANYGDAVVNIRPCGDGKYAPEVYAPTERYGSTSSWEIETVSYGSLSIDEFDEFQEANDRAYHMVKELSNIDLTTLEHES